MSSNLIIYSKFELENDLKSRIESCFKKLLEKKHLYQNVKVIDDNFLKSIKAKCDLFSANIKYEEALKIIEEFKLMSWEALDPSSVKSQRLGYDDVGRFSFKLNSIKSTCGNCAESGPMNLLRTDDALKGVRRFIDKKVPEFKSVFTFTFHCQSCRNGLEVFQAQRDKDKITLTGRSPMEIVNIPNFIPNDFNNYFTGAIIAYNSGQVLPALFMLRVFIEQYCRSDIDENLDKADSVIQKYAEGLPVDFKSQYPSLYSIYGDLSSAIHSANESEKIFLNCKERIEVHFDGKRIYDKAKSLKSK
ncbi:MAG: hypothetical protein CL666_10535 [Balneola sp.]|nr:hypothetical protein [Balneola sp.]|tara:strand:- start:44388 stop:45296 length:909 start_codon:yes stop_codon:yes gene_type:complete